MYYKTKKLYFKSHDDLDTQLDALELQGWSLCVYLEEVNPRQSGYGVATIKFKVDDNKKK